MTDDRALVETMSAETPALNELLSTTKREADATPDRWLGTTLSNVYRVEEKIGEGGMGAVYAARHIHLGKRYAIKVLSFDGHAYDNAIERLKQEAVAASRIDHENIVEVISFDQNADGAVFIVMEMLDGTSLHHRLRDRALTEREALTVAWQVANALAAAHKVGIIHRDLKPENVMLVEKRGRALAKVLDFGISKVKSNAEEDVRITRTGQLVGTPLYMSPEQARGEPNIDARIDVYALGIMLYEMLTGSTPFEGQNYFQLLWKHGNESPEAPRKRNPKAQISEATEKLVLRALEKDRDSRIPSMEAFCEAIVEIAPGIDLHESSASLKPAASGARQVSRSARRDENATSDIKSAVHEKKPRTVILWGIGLAVLVAAVVALAPRSSGVETPLPPTVTNVQSVPTTQPGPVPAVAPAAMHTLHFASHPDGASVYAVADCATCAEHPRLLCTTPCEHEFAESPEEHTFSIEKTGYRAVQVRGTLLADGVHDVELPSLPRRNPREAAPSGLPLKRNM